MTRAPSLSRHDQGADKPELNTWQNHGNLNEDWLLQKSGDLMIRRSNQGFFAAALLFAAQSSSASAPSYARPAQTPTMTPYSTLAQPPSSTQSQMAAAAGCGTDEESQWLQRANIELDAWETRSQATLAPGVRADLAQRFCEVGTQLVEEGVAASDILDNASAPIAGYLDQLITSDSNNISLEDRVVALVSLGSGPALPEPQRMGVIRVIYRISIDRFELEGKTVPQSAIFVTSLGNKSLAGFRGGQRACAGSVRVGMAPVSFTC